MRWRILPLIVVAFAACEPPTTDLTDAEKAAIAEEVNAVHGEFLAAWSAADWERGMSYYLKSPDLLYAFEGVADFGWEAVDGKYRPGFAGVASQTFTIGDSRTAVLARNVVAIVLAGSWSQTDTAGTVGPAADFALTAIWVLHDGEWKLHVAHISQPAPAPDST